MLVRGNRTHLLPERGEVLLDAERFEVVVGLLEPLQSGLVRCEGALGAVRNPTVQQKPVDGALQGLDIGFLCAYPLTATCKDA